MKNRRRHCFSLIEVVVAVGVLGLGLVAFLTLANSSQRRLIRAKERWQNLHMLTQAAEYYLMHPGEETGDMSYEFFDYPGYKVICYYTDAEDLPEEFSGLDNQAPLRSCIIELIRVDGDLTLEKLIIDRIMYDEESREATDN